MFTQTPGFRAPSQSIGRMYRQIGVETGVASASPHQLVAMLFDGFVESITQARGALASGQIEVKARAISRAARIVEEGLKGCLNIEEGGPIARDLNELYRYVALRLTQANLRNDDAALDECLRLIEPLQSAWTGIGAQVGGAPR